MRRISIIFFLLTATICAKSQIISVNTGDFAASVPSLDVFLSRFNGIQHNPYTADYFAESELRKANIVLLFDFNYVNQSDRLKRLAMEFAEYVASNNINLSLLDSLFFLEVECPVEYKGKMSSISLTIQAKSTSATTYKWVIVDARGDMLEMAEKDSHSIIMPHEHSLNFMKMISKLERYPNTITSLVSDDCIPNSLTALCALVSNKLLLLKPITNDGIVFHFLQIPGYVFSVKRQLREGSNSGWLITNIERCTAEQKQDYFNQLKPHTVKTADSIIEEQYSETGMLLVRHKVHEYYDLLNNYLTSCPQKDSTGALQDDEKRIIAFFDSPNQTIVNDIPYYYFQELEYDDIISLSDYIKELSKLAESSNVNISVSVNKVVPIANESMSGNEYMVTLYKMISVDGEVTCIDEFLVFNTEKEKFSIVTNISEEK